MISNISPINTLILRVSSTGICVIIQDRFINPKGAVPMHVTNMPKLFPLEDVDA